MEIWTKWRKLEYLEKGDEKMTFRAFATRAKKFLIFVYLEFDTFHLQKITGTLRIFLLYCLQLFAVDDSKMYFLRKC